MKKIISLVLLLSLAFTAMALTGCNKTEETSQTKPTVAVSIVPEETFVKAVCGDLVDVVTMVPAGSNPENYEPTPKQMETFSKANLYFSIGVPTESANILPKVSKDTKLIKLQDVVSQKYKERTFDSGERDPHIWLSPKRTKVIIEDIRDEMIALDKKNEATYKANADKYFTQLDEVDQAIKDSLKDVTSKSFIVYHPAFGYLAEDYGLKMYSLEEEGKEATPDQIKKMVDFAKENNIKVIFYQAEIDSSQSAAFAEEIGGKTAELAPLSPDYINNLKNMAKVMGEAMK